MFDLEEALTYVVKRDGSDLHLKVPSRPLARIHGQLVPLEYYDPMKPEDTERVLQEMLADHHDRMVEFDRENEVDFAFAVPGLARFRVNAFRQRGSVSIVARVIAPVVRTIEELGLPKVIGEIADEERGLILLTGTTGSGKSTTLAAIINHINETKSRHIVTIEDPIEYLHPDKQSIVNQREIGMDTASFSRAMRRVLRQDPDVILIGEMRDEETVRTALSAAETGHLVLSTVHTLDAPESVNRIIDFFQPHEQNQARAMLAGTLKGVVSQRLVPTPDGNSRVAVCEILRMTGRARDMVTRPRTDRPPARGDRRGRVLRDADVRPGAAAPLPGRAGLDRGRPARRRRARTTSSCWSPATAGRRRRWTTSSPRSHRCVRWSSPAGGGSDNGDGDASTAATTRAHAACWRTGPAGHVDAAAVRGIAPGPPIAGHRFTSVRKALR